MGGSFFRCIALRIREPHCRATKSRQMSRKVASTSALFTELSGGNRS
jgi:hypothetical protein